MRVSTSVWMGNDENPLNSSWCYCLSSINYSSSLSRLCSDGEILSCNFLSKWSSEYRCSEVKVRTSLWMGNDENCLNSSWCSYLRYINYSSGLSILCSDAEIFYWNFLSKWWSTMVCLDEISVSCSSCLYVLELSSISFWSVSEMLSFMVKISDWCLLFMSVKDLM